jgi:hypothetical protein
MVKNHNANKYDELKIYHEHFSTLQNENRGLYAQF